jgi:hypothetical protein
LSTTTAAESPTVNRIVNFNVKYQSFIVVGRPTFHEDDEAILGSIKWDSDDKTMREVAGAATAAAMASTGRSSLRGMLLT